MYKKLCTLLLEHILVLLVTMKGVVLVVLWMFLGSFTLANGFFFKMATTEAPTTPDIFANKPIIIHHHHKWKFVNYPTTTTEAPWLPAWVPASEAPPPHWHYPQWDVKPVVEPQTEAPVSQWQPYYWTFPPIVTPTTTIEPPKWVVPSETPPKWAYKRESTGDDNAVSLSKISENVRPPIEQQSGNSSDVTTSTSRRKRMKRVERVKKEMKKEIAQGEIRASDVTSTVDPVEAPDEVDIRWAEKTKAQDFQVPSVNGVVPVESPVEEVPSQDGLPNVTFPTLYKYIYKVHSPVTKDIKMHQEESNGQHVTGHYSLVEPDGSTRVVYYTAGEDGFNAQVKHFDWSLKRRRTT